MQFTRITVAILVLAIAAGAGLWAWQTARQSPPEITTATVLPAGPQVPAFSLYDEHGEPVGREFFEGQWDLVFFGFTHCPDICPTTLATLSTARRQLAEAGAEVLPRIVLVSVDPARDTPQLLREYVAYFGDDVAGLTGREDEITRLTDALGIFFKAEETDAENYNVDHSAVVLAIDPSGRFAALFSAPHRVEAFVNDFPGIAAL